ncbi:hypothetical protein L1987_51383 [Smallanthus sonchifolius]|uniref:Uncharacterized protein n=1 Tax=Smallanthus sonchifolius TaxID=185202 RepID=A0ACB9EPV5_9ASTR|nr:hypothetical protein L1987_51383 [Smallanthus sonchifolius]
MCSLWSAKTSPSGYVWLLVMLFESITTHGQMLLSEEQCTKQNPTMLVTAHPLDGSKNFQLANGSKAYSPLNQIGPEVYWAQKLTRLLSGG